MSCSNMFADKDKGVIDDSISPEDYKNFMMQDLQLAAELGKTLLERNKELESTLRKKQILVDDQAQEIEYLTKQTAALREVNNSRLRIYEQLEVSIQELEKNNQRLSFESSTDKKKIKSLCHSIDSLEARCEELTRQLEEKQTSEGSKPKSNGNAPVPGVTSTTNQETCENDNAEEQDLAMQLAMLKAQKTKEQKRADELEEQLMNLIQENATLEEHIANFKMREEQLRSFEEEVASLQFNQICMRCSRKGVAGVSTAASSVIDDDISSSIVEEESNFDDTDADTDVQSIASETHNTILSDSPYRVLVEKYEALLSIQRRPSRHSDTPSTITTVLGSKMRNSPIPPQDTGGCLSLQEELQLSEEIGANGPASLGLEEFSKVEEGEPSNATDHVYFSKSDTEATSTTSAFDNGHLNQLQDKAIQTDLMSGGGKLLWSISAPGGGPSDCIVHVYDESADPMESRFQQAPEYKELFSEIFSVLKKSVGKSAAASDSKAAPAEKRQRSPDPQISGMAENKDDEAGKIEVINRDDAPSPSSILSLASGSKRKTRRAKNRSKAERKAEQLRRKVLALTPEQLSHEKAGAAAAEAGLPQPLPPHMKRDPSPASSERSDSSRRGRHWVRRNRPMNPTNLMPWTRYQKSQQQPQQQKQVHSPQQQQQQQHMQNQQHFPQHPQNQHHYPQHSQSQQHYPQHQQAQQHYPQHSNVQQHYPQHQQQYYHFPTENAARPSLIGSPSSSAEPASKPPPVGFTSMASADVARLKNLEKSYAEVLRAGMNAKHRRM
ncbi:cerebellar degeneration-related protein 2-like isoform X1 [Neocloeon triangulifer]|uniref:cerebellar degeneration-related protein 2-like isoform X1 n=1 Tax=Neocloeon triangulifer TaxID=2078957 RepID=UPI00286F3670|nr:cerebellar degeneration-related protein 2-like isoform X1 [Neocloeon triangulifer]